MAPFSLTEPEFGEHEEQDLEVVFLFVANRVDLPVQIWEILKSKQSRADVLCHVNCGAVFAEKETDG